VSNIEAARNLKSLGTALAKAWHPQLDRANHRSGSTAFASMNKIKHERMKALN